MGPPCGDTKKHNDYINYASHPFCVLCYNIGPDGIRDHQATVLDPNTYVGIGTMSPEGTSNLNYLWRPPRVGNFYKNFLII